MRFVTFRTLEGHAHVGVVKNQALIDLTLLLSGLNQQASHTDIDMTDFIAMGGSGLEIAMEVLQRSDEELTARGLLAPLDRGRLLAPVPRPKKNVMCLGRNYPEHAAESVRAFKEAPASPEKPDFPNIFTKATTAINGPYADIPYDPSVSEEIDWEAELAVVIGSRGKNIRAVDAFKHIFGYMVLNDISARDIQKRHANQYFKGKSLDGSCPTGPWIVTADEVPNPDDLRLTLRLNGIVKQDDRTSSMLFSIAEIIEQMSFGMTLEPGDIIATGTPAGVGMARSPREFLKPGDVVECEVEHIGIIRNKVVQA